MFGAKCLFKPQRAQRKEKEKREKGKKFFTSISVTSVFSLCPLWLKKPVALLYEHEERGTA